MEREEEPCGYGNDTSTGISSPQTTLWGEETGVSDTEIAQSKGKEIESKEKEKKTTPTPRGETPQEGGKEEEVILMDGRKVPAYCLNKRTHNYDGLLFRLNQIHVTDVKVVNTILKHADYGKLGHPLWGIISYNNWPAHGIKFPGKFILSQLKMLGGG